MGPGRRRPCTTLPIALAIALAGSWPAAARGDGGTLRAWQQHGRYDIAVFTDPTPFVTGPVDISVLLLDRATGGPIDEARVTVTVAVAPAGRPATTTRHPATTQAATNKLLRAAVFELREAGRCAVEVDIEVPDDRALVRFELDVGKPWAPAAGVWYWILWPLPAIALYGIHRRLVGRQAARCLARGPEHPGANAARRPSAP